MNNKHGRQILGILVLSLLLLEPAIAGPGGYIAKAAFETVLGRILLGALILFFMPLIILTVVKEKIATRRARKDLAYMAALDPRFDWFRIQQRAKECFNRVHDGWDKKDLSGASDWMTDWYWQNQQLVHLERWESEGLENVCKVKKIKSAYPLLFSHYNHEENHEGSIVSMSITAHLQDYLRDKSSGKVVEGSKKFKDVETIWTLAMHNGIWKVADIDEGDLSLDYAAQMKLTPPIETTVGQNFTA